MNSTQWAGVGMLGFVIYLAIFLFMVLSKNKTLAKIGQVLAGILVGVLVLGTLTLIGSMIFFPNLF